MNRARKAKAKERAKAARAVREAMQRAVKVATAAREDHVPEERVGDLMESAREVLESATVRRDGEDYAMTQDERTDLLVESLEEAAGLLDEAESELRSVRKGLRVAADALLAAVRAARKVRR